MDQFKQQTLTLLREQVSQLKIVQKQLELKDQEIKFLKDTIMGLEEEKQQLNDQIFNMKNRMKTIVEEVTTYNSTVVSRVHHDNNSLIQEIQQLKSTISDNISTINRLTSNIKNLENKHSQSIAKIKQYEDKIKCMGGQLDKYTKTNTNLERQIQSLKDKQVKLTLQNQQLQQKLTYFEQQLIKLTNKYKQSQDIFDKKFKKVIDNTVPLEKYKQLQSKYQNIIKNQEQLSLAIIKCKQQQTQHITQINTYREHNIQVQIKNQMQIAMFEADIANLQKSIKLNKKICEFESKYQTNFQEIWEHYKKLRQQNEQFSTNFEKYEEISLQLQKKLIIAQSQINELEQQNNLIKSTFKEQIDSVSDTYESQLLELTIKLKKQEKGLQKLNIKQLQLKNLQKQYILLQHDHKSLQEASSHTIENFNKENNQLLKQLNEMIQLCQNNIECKNIVNKIKYILNDLLVVIYYLHNLILVNKERTNNIYLPFIENFIAINKKPKTALSKFRVGVYAVIAMLRLKPRQKLITNKGLGKHAQTALLRKQKNGNINKKIQELMEICLAENVQINKVIKSVNGLYRWNMHSYPRVVLENYYNKKH